MLFRSGSGSMTCRGKNWRNCCARAGASRLRCSRAARLAMRYWSSFFVDFDLRVGIPCRFLTLECLRPKRLPPNARLLPTAKPEPTPMAPTLDAPISRTPGGLKVMPPAINRYYLRGEALRPYSLLQCSALVLLPQALHRCFAILLGYLSVR